MPEANIVTPVTPSSSREFDAAYVAWKDWDAAEFGRYSPLDARYFESEFGGGTYSAARALDIGFGNGPVLAWLRDRGADVYGVEANPVLVDRAARQLGTSRIFSNLQDSSLQALVGTFTHVIALDVMEHVPLEELPSILARIRELLAPEGIAVLRFPNGDSPFGRLNQHGDPTHVTTLGGERLAYFARRAGFVVLEIRAPALPASGVGLVRGIKRRLMHFARGLIEHAVSRLYLGGRRIPLDPNYTAVLQRPR